ncbi:Hint domain-containing protein [Jiella pelagia]|uniref:Hint domain-containing protein n=1 Tax=Jiella pelagia TaxID=2986949 RepID=A0ABY7BTN0_9HYPH|nr:Hint domain-containing protein [Jiella pelagia]WAP67064.1 Hint domain-containing protein [Jiella pelagia]
MQNGPTDDLTQLGDVPSEAFIAASASNSTFAFEYVAATSNGDGFIAKYPTTGGYYLFQYGTAYDGGSVVTTVDQPFAIQCFMTGTAIATTRGPVPVEDFRPGLAAVTATGTERVVIWVGRRTISCAGENAHMAPVRVRAGAFGTDVPERDVFLSPGHPVLVRQNGAEVFVPIMNLINGTTIERTSMQSVTYWHIELDSHDVLLAEGLPAESFFDMGSRGWFDDDLDDVLANPDLIPAGQHGRCRAVAIDGPLVEAERRRLADLFYADLAAQCAWPTTEQYAVS